MMFLRQFHSSGLAQAALPPIVKPLTRRAKLKHLVKLKELKEKQGDKFRFLSKHRRYPGLPGYIPPAEPKPAKFLEKFFAKSGAGEEKEIIKTTTNLVSASNILTKLEKSSSETEEAVSADGTLSNTFVQDLKGQLPFKFDKKAEELKTFSGIKPAYSVSDKEFDFLVHQVPKVLKDQASEAELNERAEIVSRILSLENASQNRVHQFNKQQAIDMLKRHETDIGSPEIQVAMYSIKIMALKEHLKNYRKDDDAKRSLEYWESKRRRMLNYLRMKDLGKFVQVCKVVGVEPATM